MAQYKDGTYIVKDGELYKLDIKVKFPADAITVPLSDFIKKTNADRIRTMTDEELADGIAHGFERPTDMSSPWCNLYCNEHDSVKCGDCILEWLKKEVDE